MHRTRKGLLLLLFMILLLLAATLVLDLPWAITGQAVGGAGLNPEFHSGDLVLEFVILLALVAGICFLEISLIRSGD